MNVANLLPDVEQIARQAGELIKNIYTGGQFEQFVKDDQTPVTSADYAAHKLITQALKALTPDIPVLSEEDCDIPFSQRTSWKRYWLIDPLDGTQEFVAASDDFATSIALVENHTPVMGVIYAPVHRLLYSAVKGGGATKVVDGKRSAIHIKDRNNAEISHLAVAISRVQQPELITQLLASSIDYTFIPLGSSTLKSCLVAEGGADCYIRIGPTGEWDTGAAQCILVEAGGQIRDLNFQPLSYNQTDSLENPNFISLGDTLLPWETILIV